MYVQCFLSNKCKHILFCPWQISLENWFYTLVMQFHSLGEEQFWPTTLPSATLVQWNCYTVASSQNNEESNISEWLSLIKTAVFGKESFSSMVEANLRNISGMPTFSVNWNFVWAQPDWNYSQAQRLLQFFPKWD